MKVRVNLYFPFRDEIPENPMVLELPEGAVVAKLWRLWYPVIPRFGRGFMMRKAGSSAIFPPSFPKGQMSRWEGST